MMTTTATVNIVTEEDMKRRAALYCPGTQGTTRFLKIPCLCARCILPSHFPQTHLFWGNSCWKQGVIIKQVSVILYIYVFLFHFQSPLNLNLWGNI